jgi:hypothetical protein
MRGRGGRIVRLLTTSIGIVVVLIAEGQPGGGRGGGARHPHLAWRRRSRCRDGREEPKAKPSATTYVERGDQARVICSKR